MSPNLRVEKEQHNVLVSQHHRKDAPEFPVVVIKLKSKASTHRHVTLEYSVPAGFRFENLYLARDAGDEYWEIDETNNLLTYTRTLTPNAEAETILGFEDIPLAQRQTILEAGPTVEVTHDPDAATKSNSDAATSHAENGHKSSADTTAPESSVDGDRPHQSAHDDSADTDPHPGSGGDRLAAVEEDVVDLIDYRDDLSTLLGPPNDPMDGGEFDAMKEDLEIVVKLLSDLRADVDEMDPVPAPEMDAVKSELDTISQRLEAHEDALDNYRKEVDSELSTIDQRLTALEQSHRNLQETLAAAMDPDDPGPDINAATDTDG